MLAKHLHLVLWRLAKQALPVDHNKQNLANKLLLNFFSYNSGKRFRQGFCFLVIRGTLYQKGNHFLQQETNILRNDFPYTKIHELFLQKINKWAIPEKKTGRLRTYFFENPPGILRFFT